MEQWFEVGFGAEQTLCLRAGDSCETLPHRTGSDPSSPTQRGDERALSASPAALKEQRERTVRCFVSPRMSMGFLLFNKVSCCELEY